MAAILFRRQPVNDKQDTCRACRVTTKKWNRMYTRCEFDGFLTTTLTICITVLYLYECWINLADFVMVFRYKIQKIIRLKYIITLFTNKD